MRLVPLILLALICGASAEPADRRAELSEVLRAELNLVEAIAANCIGDANVKLAAKDDEIAKLKDQIKAAGEKAAPSPQ